MIKKNKTLTFDTSLTKMLLKKLISILLAEGKYSILSQDLSF
jgi:hypothetical protein